MPTPHPLIKVDPSKFYVVYESGGRWNFLVKLGYPDKFQATTFLRRAVLMESDEEAGDPEEMDFLQGCQVKSGQELISKGLKVIRPSKVVTESGSRIVLKRIIARLEQAGTSGIEYSAQDEAEYRVIEVLNEGIRYKGDDYEVERWLLMLAAKNSKKFNKFVDGTKVARCTAASAKEVAKAEAAFAKLKLLREEQEGTSDDRWSRFESKADALIKAIEAFYDCNAYNPWPLNLFGPAIGLRLCGFKLPPKMYNSLRTFIEFQAKFNYGAKDFINAFSKMTALLKSGTSQQIAAEARFGFNLVLEDIAASLSTGSSIPKGLGPDISVWSPNKQTTDADEANARAVALKAVKQFYKEW